MAKRDQGYLELLDEERNETKEYDMLTQLLTWNNNIVLNDIVRQSFDGISPATFGVSNLNDKGDDTPVETYFTPSHDLWSNQWIDYILEFRRKSYATSENDFYESTQLQTENKSNLSVEDKGCCIEKFEIKITDRPYTQISDHYGLSVNITC